MNIFKVAKLSCLLMVDMIPLQLAYAHIFNNTRDMARDCAGHLVFVYSSCLGGVPSFTKRPAQTHKGPRTTRTKRGRSGAICRKISLQYLFHLFEAT